jgi:hypothetical protein
VRARAAFRGGRYSFGASVKPRVRKKYGVGPRDAAIKLEVSAKRGRLVPKSPAAWRSMMAVLAKY